MEAAEAADLTEKEAGDYWLPWHIDSNFVTVLHRERYVNERTSKPAEEPEKAGLLMMNPDGDVRKLDTSDDVMILQMGAFGQIYAGGMLNAARHAVQSPRPPGIARFNFCNFWYVPWETLCDSPKGFEDVAVSTGWNAMMDKSYLDISQRQGFTAFRQFMTSPEARAQFADSVQFKELSELLPLPSPQGAMRPDVVVDVLSDVRCPFSFISQLNLDAALRKLELSDNTMIRYSPVFLNPHVPPEGESLDDYLLREYGYTKEYAHSKEYPLRVAGLSAGVELNPHRRVVNTFNAFVVISAAQEFGKQHEVAQALSHRYFALAEDISKADVLAAAVHDAGLAGEIDVSACLADAPRLEQVRASYDMLSSTVGEVPHFLLREYVSGNGVDIGGHRSVEEWEAVLRGVFEKARTVGLSIPGPFGSKVWLAEGVPYSPVSLSLTAQHGWQPEEWPYTAEDFSRMDESDDTSMYQEPRVVNHLDDSSLSRLTAVYRSAFGSVPEGFAVLDLCSSWTSHFPDELVGGARVVAHGLNQAELDLNKSATETFVQDLNADAKLPLEDGTFDFVTLALSVQYLTDPRAVFSEVNRVLKPGGMAIIAHSHRCFIEKATRLFANATDDGEAHTHHVCRYIQHGSRDGWERLSTVDVSPRSGDPVWIVTAIKAD